jgi:hypothetical protein
MPSVRPGARHDAWWESQIRIAPCASPPSIARSARLRAGIGALRGDHVAQRGDQALRTLPGADDMQVSTRYVVYLFKRICRSLHPGDGA